MAGISEQQQPTSTSDSDTNPVLAFFSNFLKLFNLPPPFPAPAKKSQKVEAESNSSAVSISEPTKANAVVDQVAVQDKKPSIVRYPHPAQEESFPSLKIEGDEVQERDTSSPTTLWQVYALGGFLVLSWAWRRWNERKGSKKSPEEDPPAPE